VRLPPAVYFALTCANNINIGHRHLLPVYPFLCVAVGIWVREVWDRRGVRWLLCGLGLWHGAGAFRASPYPLAYFNEAVGGPDRGYHHLTDSNVDWGQGLPALRRHLDERKAGAIYLSYFGTADPAAYGISYAPVAPQNLPRFPDAGLDLSREPRRLLAISVTNFQGTYDLGPNRFAWLKTREPQALLARSLLVYDLTDDPDAVQRLEAIRRADPSSPSP
jgi:hypothetical protein